jgi:hypothetical protein
MLPRTRGDVKPPLKKTPDSHLAEEQYRILLAFECVLIRIPATKELSEGNYISKVQFIYINIYPTNV